MSSNSVHWGLPMTPHVPQERPARQLPLVLSSHGKDEMNLSEFPFASLHNRTDDKDAIVYEGSIVDESGDRQSQKWVVRGLSGIGVPTEFDERVYVALMAVTASQDFADRKIAFSIYQLLKIMQIGISTRAYRDVEHSLDRLVGVTFKSEGAFWDHARQERLHTTKAFHLIEEYWLAYREKDDRIREEEAVPAYVVWSRDIWNSFQAGYIKSLDKDFFFSLETAVARRLYRFLDKRMRYQDTYEIDIFDLTDRLAMARYEKPTWARRKLQPALDELIERGFLVQADTVRVKGYTRVRFVKADKVLSLQAPPDAAILDDPSLETADRLVALGVAHDKAERLATTYPPGRIEQKIEYLAWKLDSTTRSHGRPVTDPAAWLVRAIERDYKPPAAFKTRSQRLLNLAAANQRWEETDRQQQEDAAAKAQQRQEGLEQLYARYGTTEREKDLWEQILGQLQRETMKPSFHMWFAPTRLLSIRDGVAVLGVVNKLALDWLSERAQEILREHLEREVGTSLEIRFEIIQLLENDRA